MNVDLLTERLIDVFGWLEDITGRPYPDEWYREQAIAILDASDSPDPSWQTGPDGFVLAPLINHGIPDQGESHAD